MRQPNGGESEHDYVRDVRLWNWGAWGRQNPDRPDNERGCSSIYGKGRGGKETITSYKCQMCKKESQDNGRCCGLPLMKLIERITPVTEALPEPINDADAESLDVWIKQLDDLHKEIIREKFYYRDEILRSDTDAAVRALLDKMADNRRVNSVMRDALLRWT